jgi:hypothetical protein
MPMTLSAWLQDVMFSTLMHDTTEHLTNDEDYYNDYLDSFEDDDEDDEDDEDEDEDWDDGDDWDDEE